jgi:ankyrin repeat protein
MTIFNKLSLAKALVIFFFLSNEGLVLATKKEADELVTNEAKSIKKNDNDDSLFTDYTEGRFLYFFFDNKMTKEGLLACYPKLKESCRGDKSQLKRILILSHIKESLAPKGDSQKLLNIITKAFVEGSTEDKTKNLFIELNLNNEKLKAIADLTWANDRNVFHYMALFPEQSFLADFFLGHFDKKASEAVAENLRPYLLARDRDGKIPFDLLKKRIRNFSQSKIDQATRIILLLNPYKVNVEDWGAKIPNGPFFAVSHDESLNELKALAHPDIRSQLLTNPSSLIKECLRKYDRTPEYFFFLKLFMSLFDKELVCAFVSFSRIEDLRRINPNFSNKFKALVIIGDAKGCKAFKDLNIENVDLNQQEFNCLTEAVMAHHQEVIDFLFKYNIDVNFLDNQGFTPLIGASFYGRTESVRLLIEKGADPNAQNQAGWTALMVASKRGHTKIVRLLIEKGANLEVSEQGGWTALMCASAFGHTEVARLLIEKGANLDVLMQGGLTALMLASQFGHTEVARLLIEKGANLDVSSQDGFTALMLASRFGHTKIVRLLIEKGANLEVSGQDGLTALMCASVLGHT